MIKLTRYDGLEVFINAELVQSVESRPDTIITLTTGERLFVKESEREVVDRIVHYKQLIHQPPGA